MTMLASGGISLCSMPGFEPTRNEAERDINCQFPIYRLCELVAAGEIGSLAARFWS